MIIQCFRCHPVQGGLALPKLPYDLNVTPIFESDFFEASPQFLILVLSQLRYVSCARLAQLHTTQESAIVFFRGPRRDPCSCVTQCFKAKANKIVRKWRRKDYKRSVIDFNNSFIELLHMSVALLHFLGVLLPAYVKSVGNCSQVRQSQQSYIY